MTRRRVLLAAGLGLSSLAAAGTTGRVARASDVHAQTVASLSPTSGSRPQNGSPWYDVTAFGAKGDGSTDDTAACQAALNDCHSTGGGAVIFPWTSSGYSLTAALTVYGNTTVIGPGWGCPLLMTGAWTNQNGCFVVNSGAQNVVFEDLFVNCLKASKPTTSTARGIYIPNATSVRVNRCLIKDPSYEGVGAWAGQDIGVTNCRFVGGGDSISQGQRSHAIGFSGNTRPYLTDVFATGNHIEGAMDTGIGLYTAVSNAIILGNTINTATGLDMKAIDLVAPFRSLISNNAIHLTGDCAYAIGLQCHTSALSPYDVSIVGNSIEGSALTQAQGIQLYALAPGLSVRRVTITANVVRGIKNSGIYIGGTNGASNLDLVVVTGNVSTDNGGDGLTMTQAGGSNVMTNNVVTANIFNGNTGYGINFGNSIQNGNSIHDNILTGNTAGAYANSGSSQTIS